MKWFRNLLIVLVIFAGLFIGIALLSGATFGNMFDMFTSTDDYILQDPITHTDVITELDVDLETRDLIIESTSEAMITIEHYRLEEEIWNIELSEGTLTISQRDEPGIHGWFNWHIGVGDKDDVIVYIPDTYVFEIDAMTNTGTIELSNFDVLNDVSLETDTGSINVDDIMTPNLIVSSDTGSLTLTDVEVTNDVNLETNTGGINITNLSAEILHVDVDTGSINISNLTANQIDLLNDTGSINVTDVDLTNRSMLLQTDTGSVSVNGNAQGKTYQVVYSDESFYLNAETDTGSISIHD